MLWLPKFVFAREGVCEDDELSHVCSQGDFSLFSYGDDAVIEGSEGQVEAGGGDGGHVEGLADMDAPALDVAAAAALAAVAGDRGEADDQGDRADGSDAGDGCQNDQPFGQEGVGRDLALDFFRRGLRFAVSAAQSWRLISSATGRAVVAPSWLSREVRAASTAGRQRVSSWGLSMSSLGGAVASGSRLSPRIASIRQSTRSVLAKAPAALANSRERNGLTMATAKPALGGKRASRGRLGKDRSSGETRHSIGSARWSLVFRQGGMKAHRAKALGSRLANPLDHSSPGGQDRRSSTLEARPRAND